jgi:ribosome assembly protein 1
LQENVGIAQLGSVEKCSFDKSIDVKLRTVPMPPALRQFLMDEQKNLIEIEMEECCEKASKFIQTMKDIVKREKKEGSIPDIGVDWDFILGRIVSFGPKSSVYNLLCTGVNVDANLWKDFEKVTESLDYHLSTVLGFQKGVSSGPLCSEPMAGVILIIEKYQIDPSVSEQPIAIPGQIVSIFRDTLKQGFLHWSPRLMLAMYSCEIQTDPMYLGSANEVLSRRRGKIIAEDVKDGTMLFTISAILPIVESFGFVEEIRTNTSGVAQPQLLFHGFEVLEEDPFWVPSTEEELEDLGEKADRDNLAKKYMEAVRVRKGMAIERKLADPEKQRNLKSK